MSVNAISGLFDMLATGYLRVGHPSLIKRLQRPFRVRGYHGHYLGESVLAVQHQRLPLSGLPQ
jgi:hypothetical protein